MKNIAHNDSRRRGASLPTVIMVVTLMMMLAFTVVAIAFNHLNLTFRSSNNAKAELLAEAVLAQAIENARVEPESYGVTNDGTIELELDAFPGGKGYLTFNKSRASELGVPYSTNNRSESSVESSSVNHGVPGQSFHLVARAEVNGAFSTMEALVHIPKFPYSIASGGAIRSNGGLLVASLKPGAAYDLSLPIHEQDLEPGHLVSNSESGDSAIEMAGTNTIMGDLRSASGATIDGDTQVFGKIKLDAGKVSLPDLHAYSYDPRGSAPDGPPSGAPPNPGDIQYVNSGAGSLSVKGYNVSEGDLTVDNGISLNGGVLYVDGDLTVSAGGVQGKGAIIATGDIKITGGGEATTDNQAALISDGDITLLGTSPLDKAKFAGLIYTRGNLRSENLRLAGVFVAAGDSSDVTLKDTELYHVEEHAKVELTGPEFVLPGPAVPYQIIDGFEVQATYDMTELQANLQSYRNPNTGAGEPEYLFKFNNGFAYKTFHYNEAGNPVMVTTTGPDSYTIDGKKLGLKIFGETVISQAHAESLIIAQFQNAKGRVPEEEEEKVLRGFGKTLYISPQPVINSARASAEFTATYGRTDSQPDGNSGPFRWSIDMSEFVNESERMRVVYWARYR